MFKKLLVAVAVFAVPLFVNAQNYEISGSMEMTNSTLDLIPSVISVNEEGKVSGYLMTPAYVFTLGELDGSVGLSLKDGMFSGHLMDSVVGETAFSSKEEGGDTDPAQQTDDDYGVFVEEGEWKGYAWSDVMGWLCFGECLGSEAQVKMEETEKDVTVIPFADLGAEHAFAFEALNNLKKAEIVQGYEDGTFQPGKEVNRAEVLKMVFGAYPQEESETELPFTDTERGAWYEKYLKMAFGAGIVKGYEDNSYKPAQSVNRAEFYKILLTAVGEDLAQEDFSAFEDVAKEMWFLPYANYAKKHQLYYFGESFQGGEAVTRLEVAYAINRMMNR